MPYTSMTRYKLPREKGNPAMQGMKSDMCPACGKVWEGRHKGAHFMAQAIHPLHHISDEGVAYTEAEMKELGLPYNVSHGECDLCMQVKQVAEQSAAEGRRISERNMRAAANETNSEVGRTTDAYRPIPEAHTPVEGSRDPVTLETE